MTSQNINILPAAKEKDDCRLLKIALQKIKQHLKINSTVIIKNFASLIQREDNLLYYNKSQHYNYTSKELIRLNKLIHNALLIVTEKNKLQPPKDKFQLRNLNPNLL